MTVYDDIKRICLEAYEGDMPISAIQLLNRVWTETDIPMHCPEHHFLIPAVLLCMYHKANGYLTDRFIQDLDIAEERSKQLTGGFCGWFGACGAAVGSGIFLCVFKDINPHSTVLWGHANKITAECLSNIAALGGPRCCKRVSFTSVITASRYMKEHFRFDSNEPQVVKCMYHDHNPDCMRNNCPYYY